MNERPDEAPAADTSPNWKERSQANQRHNRRRFVPRDLRASQDCAREVVPRGVDTLAMPARRLLLALLLLIVLFGSCPAQ